MSNVVSKIQPSLFNPKKINDTKYALGDVISLCKIFGTILKTRTGEKALPDGSVSHFTQYIGAFEAHDSETGEVYNSPKTFMPGLLTDIINAQVDATSEGNVQFAFEILIKKTNTPIGYEYMGKPLLGSDGVADPLSAMRAQLGISNDPFVNRLQAIGALEIDPPSPQGPMSEEQYPTGSEGQISNTKISGKKK